MAAVDSSETSDARATLHEVRSALARALTMVDAELAVSSPSLANLLVAALEIQAAVAQIRHFAKADLSASGTALADAKAAVLARMRASYGSRADLRPYLKLQGYGSVHSVLLEYFRSQGGDWVAAEVVRALTGGQSNAERRLRELKDLGYRIEYDKMSGRYRLASVAQDTVSAARRQVVLRIRANKSLSPREQTEIESTL